MRKVYIILVIVFSVFCSCFMSSCNSEAEPLFFSVTYISEDGGCVYGNIYQTIAENENGTQVVAVANDGYEFVGWSDGHDSPDRVEIGVNEDLTVTARFAKIIFHTLTYASDEGNILIGNEIQFVREGNAGSPVGVKSKNGYRFIKWSDDITDNLRIDKNISSDVSVTAISEKIVIEFYSDEHLVRTLNVSDINYVDLNAFIGYKSSSRFLGWKFKNEISSTDNIICDALRTIKCQFNMFGIVDVDNIELQAVYEFNDNSMALEDNITIAHALGGYNGKSYQNSKEAFESSYEKGCKFFEVDLALTTDGKVVASHDNVENSFEEFMLDIRDDYTPLSLGDIIEYMKQDSNIYFDFDTLRWEDTDQLLIFCYEMKSLIGDYTSVLDRIIIEITPYNTELISILKEQLNMQNFLFTEGWYSDNLSEFEETCKFCYDSGVHFASINASSNGRWITEEKITLCHKYGIYTMAYTVNSPAIMYNLYDMGIDCIFTDFYLL